ncbi:uncharacterized protein E0L32_012080 [Thyridium curvatum]|uniref:Uncharacterized protein n=1 Tax=Thyridium curvatum TaxID=1093900 RepID=A0A507B3F2_9PEZI|nr:uncharacterized protein E0L32_012080 [Thyridium curvatum]TPX17635.1 hypothetical protein E0L32_012080 [Thyridium curvatum]
MSFLTETAVRRLATVPRTFAVSTVPRAAFSSSIILQKTATETAKDAVKQVDRAVSDKLVDGINIGATVGSKIKEAGEDIVHGKATGKAAELRGDAKEMAGEAKGKAHEVAGKAKGKAEQVKQQL